MLVIAILGITHGLAAGNCRLDMSVLLLSQWVVGRSGFGNWVGVFIQYEWMGREVARVMGNLYGRIKRDGQASRLFGNVSKSMFGWVISLKFIACRCDSDFELWREGSAAVPQRA